jgi:hypothetical protein
MPLLARRANQKVRASKGIPCWRGGLTKKLETLRSTKGMNRQDVKDAKKKREKWS